MKDGELLLNDSGAEYGIYATDITRTYPVNGHFSPEQRAIYEIVLDAQKKAMAIVKPGIAARRGREDRGARPDRGAGQARAALRRPATLVKSLGHRRFTLHGVSHWVGPRRPRRRPRTAAPTASRGVLEPGMVFTIEPGHLHSGEHGGRRSEVVEHRRAHRGHRPRDDGRLRLPLLRRAARGRRGGTDRPVRPEDGGPVAVSRYGFVGRFGTSMWTVSAPTRQAIGVARTQSPSTWTSTACRRATGSRRRARARCARGRCRGGRRGRRP